MGLPPLPHSPPFYQVLFNQGQATRPFSGYKDLTCSHFRTGHTKLQLGVCIFYFEPWSHISQLDLSCKVAEDNLVLLILPASASPVLRLEVCTRPCSFI